jgi:hypothetical protein
VILPSIGFAQSSAQGDPDLAIRWPGQLRALYMVMDAWGTGAGLVLFQAAMAQAPAPFTALVLASNARACRFYERTGGRIIRDIAETMDGHPVTHRLYGWNAAPR